MLYSLRTVPLSYSDMLKKFQQLKQLSWGMGVTDSRTRIDLLKNLKLQIQTHESQIIEALYKDFKKPKFEALLAEIYPIYKEIDFYVANLKSWMRDQTVSAPLILAGSKSLIRYTPKGCVLILSPWNYPFQLAVAPLIAAIGAGNTVMLKPSELTQNTSQVLSDIIASSSLSKFVTVVLGGVDEASQLLDLPFDHIFFTGSTRVGKIVMQKAAHHLTPVTLELGGKSPVILHESCDLDKAAESILWGKFINAGQTCVAPDYVYLPECLEMTFKQCLRRVWDRFTSATTILSHDNDSNMAQIITEAHRDRVSSLIQEARDAPGVEVETLGEEQAKVNRAYSAVTLVSGNWSHLKIGQEELFCPILPIKTYSKIDEVLAELQTHEYPLALYLFSENQEFTERVLAHTRSGGVCINDVILHLVNPQLPFGGVGSSGLGNYHGVFGFRAFSHERAIFRPSKLSQAMRFFYPPYTSSKLAALKKVIRSL